MSFLLRFSYIFSLSLSTKMYSPQAPHLTVFRRVTIEVTAFPITVSFNLIFKKEMLHLKVHQEPAPSSLIKGFPIIFKMNCRTSIPTSNGQWHTWRVFYNLFCNSDIVMAYWTYFKLDWSKAVMWVHCGECMSFILKAICHYSSSSFTRVVTPPTPHLCIFKTGFLCVAVLELTL